MKFNLYHVRFLVIAIALLGVTAISGYFAKPTEPVRVVFSRLENIQPDSMYHIGNYHARTIEKFVYTAEKLHTPYYISAPYSDTCSQLGNECSWDDYKAFHVRKDTTDLFWKTYCELYPKELSCIPPEAIH